MSDLLTEVDEAMKQERIEKLWQKYGGFFIGAIAAVILGTAANEGYKGWQKSQDIKQTNLYLNAAQSGDNAAQEIIGAAPDLNANLRGFALLNAAGIALENGETETAINTYKKVAGDTTLDPLSGYIAKHMIASIDPSLSADQKIAEYAALAAIEENPWKYHADLELALLQANEKQDYKSARESLAKITSGKSVAESLKKKAQSLEILYAAKGSMSDGSQLN